MKVNGLENLRTVFVLMLLVCAALVFTIGWVDHKILEMGLALLLMIVTNSLNRISSLYDEIKELEKGNK